MNKTLNLLKKLQKVGNVKSEFKDILSVFYKNLKIFLWNIASLPLWECGLKYKLTVEALNVWKSLPLWECGLKLWVNQAYWNVRRSLPLWECGLKFHKLQHTALTYRHSPCGSVDWNISPIASFNSNIVTPLVGVWIEISKKGLNFDLESSLPLWECGLK